MSTDDLDWLPRIKKKEENKMDKDSIIEYLKQNLSIEVKQIDVRTPIADYEETLRVQLILGDEIISESTCYLP